MAVLGKPGQARFDAIVIGSGYGGSVAALRLAEQGLSVCVLERGNEYLAGDYPTNLSELPSYLRFDGAGRKTPGGDDDALLDLRIGEETAVLLGNGLGGGSLINANVAIAPDPRIFLDSGHPHFAWPQAIQDDARATLADPAAGLAPYYQRARETLHATPFPGVRQADGSYVTPTKTKQFDAAFGTIRNPELTVYFEAAGTNPAGVKQSPCSGCGNCVTGCNFGAKGTLATSYLARAVQAGAQIFTGASVIGVSLDEQAQDPGAQATPLQMWKVQFLPTRDLSRRRLWNHDSTAPDAPAAEVRRKGMALHDAQHPDAKHQAAALPIGDPPTYTLSAPIVVLAAGSLGSTEILLHGQQAAQQDGQPLPFAEKLGERFSGNGDQLSYGLWQDAPVNAMGWSTKEEADACKPVVGPTITRIAEIKGESPRQSFLVQDGAFPGALGSVFQEMNALTGTLAQMTGWSFKNQGADGSARDPLGISPELNQHTQILLGIGHDAGDGRIVLDAKSNRAVVSWKSLKPDDETAHATSPADDYLRRVDKAMSAVEKLGAVYLSNPAWQPMPAKVQNLLSGPPLRGKLSIAHPLGGCVMADDGAHGVVNERGRVFRGATGTTTYDGLYVLDGAMVNGSLGANPFLTICALAERAVALEEEHLAALSARARLAIGMPTTPAAPQALPAQTAPDPSYAPKRPSGIEFFEVLRQPLHDAQGKPVEASLLVRFDARDMEAWYADPAHRFDTAGAQLRLQLPGAKESAPAWVTYESEAATVQVLAPGRNSFLMRAQRYPAVLLTWAILRGIDEIKIAGKAWLKDKLAGKPASPGSPGIASRALSCLRQAWHATLVRIMVYEMTFKLREADQEAAKNAGFRRRVSMDGGKYISYTADWSELIRHFLRKITFQHPRFLPRPNVWVSMTNLKVAFTDMDQPGQPWLTGTLQIDACDMVQHLMPQIKGGDTSPGIIRLLGYPALFIRNLIQTRMWDFRLPEYGVPPQTHDDQRYDAGAEVRHYIRATHRLPMIDGRTPEFHTFQVKHSRDGAPYTLGLWRYRAPLGLRSARVTARRAGEENAAPYVQCKSILLAHAFGQSALCFADPSINHGMTRALLAEGWDVWLLESRISTALEGYDPHGAPDLRSEAARRPSTLDDIAAADIPAAVDHIVRSVGGELRHEMRAHPDEQVRIFAFAQCVGAASLAMATLSGRLSYTVRQPAEGTARQPSRMAGMVLSQFLPFVIGDPGTQARTILPAFLRDAMGMTGINFSTLDSLREACADRVRRGVAPADPAANEMPGSDSLIDRILATFPVPEAEQRHDEGWGRGMDHAHATCRRIVGIEATLFAEKCLSDATHARMPILFGHANMDLFNHARKCIEYERLVDVDGRNIYVTQQNILRHLHMPIGLLHGVNNKLFSVSSSTRTAETLEGIFGATAGGVALMQIEGYGHLDPIIGQDAARDVYVHITRFLQGAWDANLTGTSVAGDLSVPPRTPPGPNSGPVADTALQSRVHFRDSVWESADDALESEYLS